MCSLSLIQKVSVVFWDHAPGPKKREKRATSQEKLEMKDVQQLF